MVRGRAFVFLYYAGSLKFAGTLVIIIGRNITRLARFGCLLVQDFALIMHDARNRVSGYFPDGKRLETVFLPY